jgi:oligoribonuclease NrnB/cAMP/cGMP phosphodiesterase (DHH superfamily)
MVDYCSEAETMKWFKNNTNFYWIDHHISSVENSKKYEFDDIKGIRKVGLCGA